MSIAMFNFFKKDRKSKWKIRAERDELQIMQQRLRKNVEILEKQISELQAEEIQAFKNNDGSKIAELEVKIDDLKEKVEGFDKRYKANADVLKTYSEIDKNDREGSGITSNAIVGAITGLGGLALAYFGLRQAYTADVEGLLPNKKTLEWVKGLPIIRNFSKK